MYAANSKRGQSEGLNLLVIILIVLFAFALIAYFSYGWFKSQTKSFEQGQPKISPIPLVAIPSAGAMTKLLKRRFKAGATPIVPMIIGIILTIIFIAVIIKVLGLFGLLPFK